MNKIYRYFSIVSVALAAVVACDHTDDPVNGGTEQPVTPQPTKQKPSEEIQQADLFAANALNIYYLWNKEISKDLERLSPDTCANPINVVHEIRYHKGNKEVDHWTSLTNNLGEMTSAVEGMGESYGYDLQAGRITNSDGQYFLFVNYVTNDSPAQKGGLKRGDLIMTIDGKPITSNNIYDVFNKANVTLGIAHLTGEGYLGAVEKEVPLTAIDMWEDPVTVTKTFDVNGKKVGYLTYNSFDIKSMETLPDIFRSFKTEGVQELILDLRYNGGGFVSTECELASLIAPYASVAAGDVFQTEVYNSILSEAWKDDDFNTYFATKFEYKSGDYDINEDISDANLNLKKMYVIVTGNSASASEGLIVGLGPYMDITLIGEQTYGKYCAGYMLPPSNLFNNAASYSLISKWGIYVMVSQFADKNGKNPANPDGIPVNVEAHDNPLDGYQLGDENETMLKAALTAAGKTYPETKAPTRSIHSFSSEHLEHGASRGMLIKTDLPSGKLPLIK